MFYIICHSNWNSVAMNQTSKTENGHRTDEWIKLNEIVVWNGLRTLGFVHKTSSIFGNPRDIIDNGYELSDKNGLFEDPRLRSVGRFYAFIFRQIFLALFMFNSFNLNGLCMFVSVSKENLLRNALTVTSACKIVSRRQSKAEPESSTICTLCTVWAIQTVGDKSLQSLKF